MTKVKVGVLCTLALLFVAVPAFQSAGANQFDSVVKTAPALESAAPLAIEIQPVLTTGLTRPVFVTNARDGSNRLFIVQQGGIIKVLQPGATVPTDFLDISTRVQCCGERGLLGLAFHPQYATNGRFFVYYTRIGDFAIQIAEYKVSTFNPNVADTTEKIIITVPHPTNSNHNGGTVLFGHDGYLYFGPGDGGSANDPPNNAQNINQLLGKINRIDINVPGGMPPYISPPTNPFAGTIPGADEIYMVGMRNPYRFSFDRQTGELWIGDVGQNQREEIDIGQRGGNFGWRTYEGTNCTGLNPTECVPTSFVFPVAEYSHTGGRCSITGGYRYRGRRGTFPSGAYVYADYCTGEIFMLEGTTQTMLLDTTLGISGFGEDEAGEIYVVGLAGSVYRIVNPAAPTPRNVFCDFDGDLKTDISVFRPSTGTWYVRQSFTNSLLATPFGTDGDTVTPGDYDGDGKTDITVRRALANTFYWLKSSNGTFMFQGWGNPFSDARVVADYDGDRKTDFAVASSNAFQGYPIFWSILSSSSGQPVGAALGTTGDFPITGDFDGDGKNDLSVYRPSDNYYYVLKSTDGILIAQQWGLTPDDRITPADYDGDGKTDIAVFRQPTGTWWILQSSNGQVRGEQFGTNGDEPVPGDYDGDGKYDLAVTRNAGGIKTWYISRSSDGALQALQWGNDSDIAVPGFQVR